MSGIGDFQEFLRCNLSRTSVGFVGEFNGRPLEAFATEFFTQSQSKHYFPYLSFGWPFCARSKKLGLTLRRILCHIPLDLDLPFSFPGFCDLERGLHA